MTRRELVASLAGGALLVACGGDDGVSSDAGVSCTENGANARGADISQNHGHVLVISMADIAAGVERTYDIMGTSLHTHSVTITAEQFAMLQTNRSITATSSVTSAHSHVIEVLCA
jgi:hypothetical protein